ncbi:unnamed protein product, partial [Brenthis ino]
MVTNVTLLLIVITMTSVASQTFQYSRGWTNGKRDGHKRPELSIDKILNPCQMQKLKYLLEGKPLTDQLLAPCDYIEDDTEKPKRYKLDRGQDSLYDAFQ